MAHVLNRTTRQFIQSANTPDFDIADWVHNPDLTAVAGQPIKYWIITGDVVSLMDGAAQAVVDADIATARSDAEKAGAKNDVDVERVVRALVDLLPGEFNILRTLHSLPDRTAAQLTAGIKANIDAQP